MPHEAPRETNREFQPGARWRDLPNKRAWVPESMPQKKRIDSTTACRRCGQTGHHQLNFPNPQVLHCWIFGRRGIRTMNCCQQRDVPANLSLAKTPCLQRETPQGRSMGKPTPITTQPSQASHLTTSHRNETYNLPTQCSSFALKVNSGNPPHNRETLETPLRSDAKQNPRTHRNLRFPCNEACKDTNAAYGPANDCPHESQRRHASDYNPHLVESGSTAAYETSRCEQVNQVTSGFVAAYEISHTQTSRFRRGNAHYKCHA
ncbi:uncharacterized protein ACN2A1_010367 isoform 1-T2 [Glossina fuscipes fuscipes]